MTKANGWRWVVAILPVSLSAVAFSGTAARGGTNQDCVNNGQMGSPFVAGTGSVTVDCQEGPFDPPGSGCGGAPGQVSGAGATLFVDFFRSPTGYNDWIDVDQDGLAGDISVFPFTDPLATLWPPNGTITTHWMFQYRSVGSVNGYNEFVENQLCHAIPLSIPAEGGLFSQFEYATGGVRTWGGPYANNSGTPVVPCEIEFSFLDVPSSWGTRVDGGAGACVPGGQPCMNDVDCLPGGRCSVGPLWDAEPTGSGYGLNPINSSTGFVSNLQSLTRQCGVCAPGGEPCTTNQPATLHCATVGAVCTPAGAPVSLNTNLIANEDTIRDFIGAWVPILYIANRGTGLQDVKYSDMQYLFTTGRMPNGENLIAATRSVGSGTRNGIMNSTGIDTSWGRGDNFGNENGVTANFNLGPNTQQTNAGGSSQVEQALEMRRLGVAYTGMAGPSRAVEDATAGRCELLNICKDVDTDGNPLCDCTPQACPAGNKVCARTTSIDCTANASLCNPTSANGSCVFATEASPNNGYVRPSVNTVLDNGNPCCGYTIGGNGSFVVRGERNANRQLADPEYQAGQPLDNQAVADYLNNIADSIRDYVLAGNFDAGACNFSEKCSNKRCSVSNVVCTGVGQGNCAAGNVCRFVPCDSVVGPACPGVETCGLNTTCLNAADCPDLGCSVTNADCALASDCIDETCNLGTLTCTQTGGPCAVDTDCPARGQTCDADYCRGSLNMASQFLATNFFLPQGIDAQQSLTDGMVFVVGGVNQALQNYIRANSVISVPAFASVNTAGLVPRRNGVSAPGYSDGSTTGSYTYWNGTSYVTNFAFGQRLARRNRIQGDFDEDFDRDINDITEMVKAHYGPRAWQQLAVATGTGAGSDLGNQTRDNAIPEVIGDMDGDGNFTKEDLRYFADGLAMVSGQLDRKQGAIAVDTAIMGLGQPLPWNDPALNLTVPPAAQPGEPTFTTPIDVDDAGAPFLKTGKPYQLGDFRGDVAGANPTPGAQPLGWDSVVDEKDIDYSCAMAQIGDWSNIDDAVYLDLSCDMDGDLDVDADDITELVQAILGTTEGDIDLDGDVDGDDRAIAEATIAAGAGGCNGDASCGWADGDMTCDRVVDDADLVFLPPGEIVWIGDPLSPLRTTRSLRFRVQVAATARGTAGQDAIKVTMVSLQRPDPKNLPASVPPNFSTFDTAVNGVCTGGTHAGHRCDGDTGAQCPGGTCGSLAGCTAAGETNGCARWVGKPGTFLESQDNPEIGNYRAARLQCTPYFHDWVAETATNPIAVVGGEIAPSSEYSVQTYAASCKGAEAGCTNVSTPVTMFTRRSGDVEAPFNPPATSTQPNAVDVTQMVNKFKNVAGALVKATTQLQPNLPELNADLSALDIVAVVDGVKELAYAFGGPCPCPSLVTCGATNCASPGVCTTTYGVGALCVKTCTGGDNAGEPCINNTHCPGGACGAGSCRDRCGRCNP